MPDRIENGIAYLNGAKIGDIYGSNYIEISNAGVLSFHGTAHIDDESGTADAFMSIAVGGTTNKATISSTGALAFAGTQTVGIDFSGSSTIQNIILGGAGRVSTGSAAGSTLNIDATTSQYGEGLELRYNISDWADTYTITAGKGMYLRMETNEANAAGSIYGMELYGVANNVDLGYLWGGLAYAYVKGVAAKTLTGVYAFQPEISFDAGSATNTITDAAIVRAKLTGGVMSDYTVLDGYRLTLGDMDGQSRTYGNGILLEDDAATAGTNSLTVGLNIAIGCTTGISISGAVTTGISVGTNAAKLSLSAAANRMISSYSTSALTTGNNCTMTISQTMTAASATNTVEVSQFILTSDVQVGNWANAILAKIDFSTNGYVTGLAGVVCAELDLPGSSTGGAGTYSCFEAEIICPASYEGNSPIHVFQINAQGATVTEFDDNGYLFDITGVSSGATGIWYDNQKAAPAVEEFIRVKTPSGVRYIGLYDANV